jgi:hypothetical protein
MPSAQYMKNADAIQLANENEDCVFNTLQMARGIPFG